jgi:hypothetical protein
MSFFRLSSRSYFDDSKYQIMTSRKLLGLAAGIALTLLAPPAFAQGSTGSDQPRTGPISGYMELHLNAPLDQVDGDPSLDFHRFVLLFSHSFSDRLRFVGELELEHAFVEGLEEAGELELEQAYIDVLTRPWLNFRGGMLLTPVGIINERHEPPVFYGVERPFVDTVIIPTTWFEVGAGVHGRVGSAWAYRAYVTAPLDATEFSADEGLRGGIQKGSRANIRNPALTGRIEFTGVQRLTLGLSGWRGDVSFNVPRIDPTVGLIEFDGRYRRGGYEARGQFAYVTISDAGQLNDALTLLTGVDPNIARALRGFYLEGSRLFGLPALGHEIGVFARYENFDTQFKMPDGRLPIPEFDRAAWVVGASYYLDPDVAIKFDYTHQMSESTLRRAPRSVNVGLGWWF